MPSYDFDIGVIGGGAAGLTVAAGSAQLGARTLLIDKDGRLGGDCLHYGCVPSKTLIRTAHVYHLMKRAPEYGLPSVETKPVDFRHVSARIRSVISKIQLHDSIERFCSLGARVEFGTPEFDDEHSVRLNGRLYSAKNWVVATGSSPMVPKISGLEDTRFITNKELYYLDRLPGSMIILGGGPIGIEMAQAFCRLGTRVYVIQRPGRILPRDDEDMSYQVMEVLKGEGVSFHLTATVLRVRDLGLSKEVVIKTAEGNETTLTADQILVATGRRPNIDGLGLDAVGVEFDEKGIRVDSRMRTSQKHIYAAGDVTGGWLFTHAAGYEGGIVVSNAIFRLPRKADYTYLPWCTYTDPELASIGMNEASARKAVIEYSVWSESLASNDRGLAEGEETGRIKLILDRKESPIGIQILGPHAGDLMGEWIAVLNGGVGLSKIAAAIHPYPTIGEINKKVASNLLSKKIFSDKVRKGLKLFFNLKGRACGR